MEAEERPKALDELGRQIQQYMKVVEAYKAKVSHATFIYIAFYTLQMGWITFLHLLLTQDELYDHLDELEMMKVEKQVNETMTWMNNTMNLQSKQSLSQDPVVKAQEIQAQTKVQVSPVFRWIKIWYGKLNITSCKHGFYWSVKLHLIKITWHVPESEGQHMTAGRSFI